jgi:hypothetical protein
MPKKGWSIMIWEDPGCGAVKRADGGSEQDDLEACPRLCVAPTGGISKQDLRRFLKWGAQHLGYPELANVEAAPPTAELEPIREGVAPQTDEQDMGMKYEVGAEVQEPLIFKSALHALEQGSGFGTHCAASWE